MTTLEFILYALLFVLIGLMFVSLFLTWHWFDARDRLKVVREVTREQTINDIRHAHNKCRSLLYTSLILAAAYIPLPFLIGELYGTFAYAGVVVLVDALILFGLRSRAKRYIATIDDYVHENEEHVREALAQVDQQRDQWRQEAKILNPQTEEIIKENLSADYEIWFPHDILLNRCVLADREQGLLFAQGVIIPFTSIMEIRRGRRDLKLVTSSSMHPFITIDFDALPINPETGNKYMDEIADKLAKLVP